MLSSIHIRNLAVVAAADLEFGAGFSVMTGETGAGKSILVDALALALGTRAEGRLVRAGAERAEVSVVFEMDGMPGAAVRWLTAQELAEPESCILRRTLTAEGRSRAFVNGQAVTLQSLRELGGMLVDICGQQAYLGLRHAPAQRALLDDFGGHAKLVAQLGQAHQAWQSAEAELESHDTRLRDRKARAELLDFQCRELAGLAVREGEHEELEQLHRRLAASEKIQHGLTAALAGLYEADQGAVHDVLARCEQQLTELAESDPRLEDNASLLREAGVLVGEVAGNLRDYLGRIEHDPEREAQVSQRLADIRSLARKHQVEPDGLPALQMQLEGELEELADSESRRAELSAELERCRGALVQAADALTRARKKAAGSLAKAATAGMRELGMPDGLFEVRLAPLDRELPGRNGAERIEFQVSTNPGLPAGALAKVASGGELSRISLALQVAARGASQAAALIFDEVDTGVGGGVAEMVGQKLRALGNRCQVLCVTHLPQVASQADHHFLVAKSTDGESTSTEVTSLDTAARVDELARMLGGVKITGQTRAHAQEMLEAAEIRKAS